MEMETETKFLRRKWKQEQNNVFRQNGRGNRFFVSNLSGISVLWLFSMANLATRLLLPITLKIVIGLICHVYLNCLCFLHDSRSPLFLIIIHFLSCPYHI
jgi:hypothetical protein